MTKGYVNIIATGERQSGIHMSRAWSGEDRVPEATPPTYYWTNLSPTSKTPRWRRRKVHWVRQKLPSRAGSLADQHNYAVNGESGYDPLITFYYVPWGPASTAKVSTAGKRPNWTYQWDSNDSLKLVNKLRTVMLGSSFDPSVFLGEGLQTLSMIASAATKLATALYSLRRGQLRNAAVALGVPSASVTKRVRPLTADMSVRSLSQDWLELQYGWMPLVNDMYDGAQFLAHLTSAPYVKTYRARRTLITSESMASDQYWVNELFGKESRQIIAFITEDLSMVQKLGLTNPLSVAWELMPWSFVVDWALPIGDYIQARGFAATLTGKFVTSAYKRQYCSGFKQNSPIWATYQPPRYAWVSGDSGDFWYSRYEMSRSVSNSLDVPFPTFKPLGKLASWAHCANALALLGSAGKLNPSNIHRA